MGHGTVDDSKKTKAQLLAEIAELRKRNEEIEGSLRTLARAVEQSPVTVVITDAKGNIEYANPRFFQLTGFTPEEAKGQNPRVLKSGKHPDSYYRELWETITSGREWKGEFLNKNKAGELFWEIAYISPVLDDAGNITHFVAVKENITQQKRMDEELTKYRETLEDLVEARTAELNEAHEQLIASERLSAIGKFAGAIAHELRNPLATADSSCYLLDRNPCADNDDARRHINKIRMQIHRCTRIIESIQRLSKREAPNPEQTLALTVLSTAVEDVEIPDNVSVVLDDRENPSLMVDVEQIRIALKNLISNAVQAMPRGGTLSLKTEQTAHAALITIADTGKGISDEDKLRVFEPLFSTKSFGMGFGLPIVKMIIERHGGEISVESEPDKGTTFTVALPTPAPGLH